MLQYCSEWSLLISKCSAKVGIAWKCICRNFRRLNSDALTCCALRDSTMSWSTLNSLNPFQSCMRIHIEYISHQLKSDSCKFIHRSIGHVKADVMPILRACWAHNPMLGIWTHGGPWLAVCLGVYHQPLRPLLTPLGSFWGTFVTNIVKECVPRKVSSLQSVPKPRPLFWTDLTSRITVCLAQSLYLKSSSQR